MFHGGKPFPRLYKDHAHAAVALRQVAQRGGQKVEAALNFNCDLRTAQRSNPRSSYTRVVTVRGSKWDNDLNTNDTLTITELGFPEIVGSNS
ncbi:hypothetical protein KFU94_00200 [Chloroflexi bacterium TSY]|nr:hypothetical protein [Chloroflexi bacterium TSY]